MTIVLLGIGAIAAALGTRLGAAAFVAAAVIGARQGAIAPVATWTAVLAASWVLLTDRSIRRFAVPAFGAAAAVGAGSASNGAAVLGLWVVATATAVLSVDQDGSAPDLAKRRWALGLCSLDVAVAATVVATSSSGLEGWPLTARLPGALVLLVAALLRAPLGAGPTGDGDAGGLLVVRTQAVVLAGYALAAGGSAVAKAALVAGAVAFSAAPFLRTRALIDVVQELSLYISALGAASIGWGAEGWTWGTLAAGTLIHQLRLMVPVQGFGPLADALWRSAGIGLPLFPVILAVLEGVPGVDGVLERGLAAIVVLGLLLGLAGRARSTGAGGRRRAVPFGIVRTGSVAACCVIASLWAVVLALPAPPAGAPIDWPPPIAGALVVAAGAVGVRLARTLVPARPARSEGSWIGPAVRLPIERLDRFTSPLVIRGSLAALGISAAGLWVVGLLRGFL